MRNPKSLLTLLICIVLLVSAISVKPYRYAVSWDVFGYYLYLPAIFYHDDIELKSTTWADEMRKKYDLSGTLYQVHGLENGNHVIQYSSGMAFMLAPAFAAGHAWAGLAHAEQDGFSWPYQLSVTIWSLLVACIGLWYLRKILLHFFDDTVAALTLFLIVAGTNLYVQVSGNLSTAHTYLFTLHAIFLWNVILWHAHLRIKNLVALTLALGIACLARPTEIIAALIFLCWPGAAYKNFFEKLKWLLREQKLTGLLMIALLVLCALPQLLYWKVTSGHYLFMSYANAGEGFDFTHPHTMDFLFSYRKGWFIYTPLMLIALSGFIYLYKKQHRYFLPFLLFVLVNVFIASSWSCWWYAACYSQRSMVQAYPEMAVLLGFSIVWMLEKSPRKWLGFSLIAFAFALNIFQSWQYENSVLDKSRMTKKAYWSIFGKTKTPADFDEMLLVDYGTTGEVEMKYPEHYIKKEIAFLQFSDADSTRYSLGSDSTGNVFAIMDKQREFLNGYADKYSLVSNEDHCWIDVELDVSASIALVEELLIVCTMDHGGNYGYQTKTFAPGAFIPGKWNKLTARFLLPPIRNTKDKLSVYLWHRGSDTILIDNFHVTAQVMKPDL